MLPRSTASAAMTARARCAKLVPIEGSDRNSRSHIKPAIAGPTRRTLTAAGRKRHAAKVASENTLLDELAHAERRVQAAEQALRVAELERHLAQREQASEHQQQWQPSEAEINAASAEHQRQAAAQKARATELERKAAEQAAELARLRSKDSATGAAPSVEATRDDEEREARSRLSFRYEVLPGEARLREEGWVNGVPEAQQEKPIRLMRGNLGSTDVRESSENRISKLNAHDEVALKMTMLGKGRRAGWFKDYGEPERRRRLRLLCTQLVLPWSITEATEQLVARLDDAEPVVDWESARPTIEWRHKKRARATAEPMFTGLEPLAVRR
eukprot:2106649-Prymnesium_polylepis.2